MASFIQSITMNMHMNSMDTSQNTDICKNEVCLDLAIGSIWHWVYESNLTFLTLTFPTLSENLAVEQLATCFQNLRISTTTGKFRPGDYYNPQQFVHIDYGKSLGPIELACNQDTRIVRDHKKLSGMTNPLTPILID